MNLKIDKKLKDQAMQKAKRDGLNLSTVLKLAIKSYVEDDLDIRVEKFENFNAKTQAELLKSVSDFKQGRKISPGFTNAEDAIKWLNDKDRKWPSSSTTKALLKSLKN